MKKLILFIVVLTFAIVGRLTAESGPTDLETWCNAQGMSWDIGLET